MTADASFATAVATAVFSSTGAWGALQFILDRKRRTREEAKQRDDDNRRAEREHREHIERERADQNLLAQAQATAQRTALDSANERYQRLHEDYQSCRDGLIQIREAAALLINVFEQFLIRMRPDETAETYTAVMQLGELGEARRAINEARRHLR